MSLVHTHTHNLWEMPVNTWKDVGVGENRTSSLYPLRFAYGVQCAVHLKSVVRVVVCLPLPEHILLCPGFFTSLLETKVHEWLFSK